MSTPRSFRAGPGTVTRYASQRLPHAIVEGLKAEHDPKTLTAWGKTVGVSVASLRAWCYTARERPKRTLDFVRVLRALTMWQGARWDPFEALDISARTTLTRLFSRGQTEFLLTCTVTPSLDTFIRDRRYLSNEAVVEEVLATISRTIG